MADQTSTEQRYLYFVSYAVGQGFGSADVFYDRPVTTFQDVQVLTQKIYERLRDRGGLEVSIADIAVLNYQALSGPPEADAVTALKFLLAHPGVDCTALLVDLDGDALTDLAIAAGQFSRTVNTIRATRPTTAPDPDPEWDRGGYFPEED